MVLKPIKIISKPLNMVPNPVNMRLTPIDETYHKIKVFKVIL
jgi:hypothetical protein